MHAAAHGKQLLATNVARGGAFMCQWNTRAPPALHRQVRDFSSAPLADERQVRPLLHRHGGAAHALPQRCRRCVQHLCALDAHCSCCFQSGLLTLASSWSAASVRCIGWCSGIAAPSTIDARPGRRCWRPTAPSPACHDSTHCRGLGLGASMDEVSVTTGPWEACCYGGIGNWLRDTDRQMRIMKQGCKQTPL
jgi:hypothetical protein